MAESAFLAHIRANTHTQTHNLLRIQNTHSYKHVQNIYAYYLIKVCCVLYEECESAGPLNVYCDLYLYMAHITQQHPIG